jgi:hypothetical protein
VITTATVVSSVSAVLFVFVVVDAGKTIAVATVDDDDIYEGFNDDDAANADMSDAVCKMWCI